MISDGNVVAEVFPRTQENSPLSPSGVRLKSVWVLAAKFWTGVTAQNAWFLTVGAFLFALIDVLMQFLLNRWNKSFYDALEQKSIPLIQDAGIMFVLLVFAATAIVMAATLFKILLQVALRNSLSEHVISAWLSEQAFYRLNILRGTEFAPEHRIAEDVRLVIEPVVDLSIGFVASLVTAVTFAGVLWSAGGAATIGGVSIPGSMVFIAIVYAVLVTSLMALFGRFYSQRIRERSEAEARFRYELTRLRENAESVALLAGEAGERFLLGRHLRELSARWHAFAYNWTTMTWVTYSNGLLAPVLPLLIMTPKYLSGEVSLGTIVQAATAFGVFQASLGWFSANFARLSEWYAAASRVAELLSFIEFAKEGVAATSRIKVVASADDKLRLTNVSVELHDGTALITDADLVVEPGEMVLVNGPSGTGKSTLVRAIAGLWPWGSGCIALPAGSRVAFLPQRTYMPNGSLRTAIAYPKSATEVPETAMRSALELTGLTHLAAVLDTEQPWDKFLSGGELQRIAFARLLIDRPTLVILDEATSALDEANEARMMELFTHHLFMTTVISVGHRAGLAAFHNRVLTIHRQETGANIHEHGGDSNVRHRIRRALADIGRAKKPS